MSLQDTNRNEIMRERNRIEAERNKIMAARDKDLNRLMVSLAASLGVLMGGLSHEAKPANEKTKTFHRPQRDKIG